MAAALPNPLPPNDDRALPSLPIYMWVGCGIATAVVGTRLATRLVLKHAAGWDDFFIALAFVFSIVLYVGTQILISAGYGHHVYYLEMHTLIYIAKWSPVVNIAGFFTLAFARTSIGLFLFRLVARVQNYSWIIWFGLALNTFQAIALILLTGLSCVPIQRMWDPTVTWGFCIARDKFTILDRTFGCINVIVDFTFALFPLLVLRGLQMQNKTRLGVYLLLSCGLLTGVCAIGRVVASDLTSVDDTWDLIPLTYWALSEVSGVLILACVPALHQLYLHLSRTGTFDKLQNYLTSRMRTTNNRTANSTKKVLPSHNSDSNNNLVMTGKDVRVQRDVRVELSDRHGSGDTTGFGNKFSMDDRSPPTMTHGMV